MAWTADLGIMNFTIKVEGFMDIKTMHSVYPPAVDVEMMFSV